MKKGTAFGRIVIVFILTLVLQVAAVIPAEIVNVMKNSDMTLDGILSTISDLSNLSDVTTLGNLIYGVVAIIVFGIWYYKLNRNYPETKFPKRISIMLILGIVFMAVGFQYVVNLLVSGIALVFPSWLSDYESLMETAGFSDMNWMLMVYSIILAPVVEEIIFRGIILKYSDYIMPLFLANIFQAFLFGLMHMNLLQGTYAFVVGIVFGLVAIKGGGVKYSIPIHILFNLVGTIGSGLLSWTLDLSPVAFEGIGCAVAVIGIILFIRADEA